jgi:hypothetical protein
MATAEKLAHVWIYKVITFLYISSKAFGNSITKELISIIEREELDAVIIRLKDTDTEHEENNDEYYDDQLSVL